jgi:hypothetical protein
MPVLDLQRRSLQIGRIRTGIQVPTGSKGKTRPEKLTTFRFTSGAQHAIEAVAALYGGDTKPWKNGSRNEWEVITKVANVGITVPAREAVVSTWYELWTRGGCQRRCDSQIERKSGGPCQCPHADDPDDAEAVERAALERAMLAKSGKACSLVTRINVSIPDLPGIGVWRLDTGSFYAAGETIDQATLLEMARAHRVALPAMLRLEQRQTVTEGETRNYAVPVIDVLTTARAIVTGQLAQGGAVNALPPMPGEQPRAITAGTTATAPEQPASTPRPAAAAPRTAQQIADDAAQATTRGDIERVANEAKELQVGDDLVCTDTDRELYEELHAYLQVQWKALPAGDGK